MLKYLQQVTRVTENSILWQFVFSAKKKQNRTTVAWYLHLYMKFSMYLLSIVKITGLGIKGCPVAWYK